MSTATGPLVGHAPALRRAAVAATRAPSVHNSQPWRLALNHLGSGRAELEIQADDRRRLATLDPYGRQLTLSCGCALFNARVALAAAGLGSTVERYPDPRGPRLLARIRVTGRPAEPDLARLEPAIELRQTNRAAFCDEPVPDRVVEILVAAAAAEGAVLEPVTGVAGRRTVARLSRLAAPQRADEPAYPTESGRSQCLLVLAAVQDRPAAWLRTGEALERVLLEIAAQGLTASPFAEVVEVAGTNAALRRELRLATHPQLLLRVGRAPRLPMTRRRRLVDVLVESE
jgi:hypothetical protein